MGNVRTGTKAELIVFLAGQDDSERLYDLTDHKEKRRLNQNSYYWKLLGLVAQKIHMGRTELHNRMLREYGLIWFDEDGQMTIKYKPDTEDAERMMMGMEKLHWAATSKTRTDKNGEIWRRWVLLLPSHLMTVKEFSALTDGMVQEAQQLGIETLTPRELEEIRQYELQNEARKSNRHTLEGENQGG